MSKLNMTMSAGNSALDMQMSPKNNGSGTSTSNYPDLMNKPQINGTELNGNKTGKELGLVDEATLELLKVLINEELAKKLNDILVNGTSIVENGVANIPIASSYNTLGLVYCGNGYGLKVSKSGELSVDVAQISNIDNRTVGARLITTERLDYAVKKALTDGKGQEYTYDEQQQAQERLGLGWKLLGDVTVEEDGVGAIRIDIDNPNYNEYQFYVYVAERKTATASNMIIGLDGVTSTSVGLTYVGVGTNTTYVLRGYAQRHCNSGWLSTILGSKDGKPCSNGFNKGVDYYNTSNANTEAPRCITVSLATGLDIGSQFIVYAR